MITPGADLKVYVATRPVDFRKGHDGRKHARRTAGLLRARVSSDSYDARRVRQLVRAHSGEGDHAVRRMATT
jgi:hypothetical protein